MKDKQKLDLPDVQETLLLPLWGRAMESRKPHPHLVDAKAEEIIRTLPYDFTTIARNVPGISAASWIARSIYFDGKISAFIERHPEAVIVNIGCGLDTTFDRIDNGTITWFDLDLPDVISLREQYIPETDRRRCISSSVFDPEWFTEISRKDHLMFIIAGTLYYFSEEQVGDLFSRFHDVFPGVEIILDYTSPRGMALANKQIIQKSGMKESSCLVWGIDDIHALERWDGNIEILDDMPMFKEYKKMYPPWKRIAMSITDKMRIMSLAHILIR